MKTGAIIGISSYARHHLLMALEQALHGRLQLLAATVINQEAEAFFCARLRQLGCEIFASVDAMWAQFAGKIDLCFIPTGIHLHARMTLQALRAGANVLVEKPLATSADDALEIMRLQGETGRFVAIGFQDLYADSTWAIKQLLLDGGIGQVKTISFAGLWPRPVAYYRRNEWAGRLRHDGVAVLDSPINNAFAHFLNLALFWAGATIERSATAQQVECELYRAQPIESFDTCCLRAQLDGRVELRAYVTHSCREERVPRLHVEGSRGSIDWHQESHYEITARNRGRQRHAVPGKFEMKLMMADAVLARIEDHAVRICDPAIAFEHMRLVEAIHAASPIMDVSTAHVRRTHTPAGEWREIIGVGAAIDEADAQRRLWAELDVPWAKRVVTLPPRKHAIPGGAA